MGTDTLHAAVSPTVLQPAMLATCLSEFGPGANSRLGLDYANMFGKLPTVAVVPANSVACACRSVASRKPTNVPTTTWTPRSTIEAIKSMRNRFKRMQLINLAV